MPTTAADIPTHTLCNWGVDTVFRIPGDSINGLMESWRQRQDKIRFIQVPHEKSDSRRA